MYFLLAPKVTQQNPKPNTDMERILKTTHLLMNSIVAGVLSSFLFLGVGGCLAMRLLTFLAGENPNPTVEGTIAHFTFSTAIGVVGGALFPVVGSYLPRLFAAKGGSWGLTLFVILIPVLPVEVCSKVAASSEWLPVSIAIFGLLFMGFGTILDLVGKGLGKFTQIQKHEMLV